MKPSEETVALVATGRDGACTDAANTADERAQSDATQGDVIESPHQDAVTGRFLPGNRVSAKVNLKLTPDRHDRIVQFIRDGNFLTTSARASGVSPRTLKRWLERGERDHDDQRDTIHARLFADAREAAAVSEAKLVNTLMTAAVNGFKQERVHKSKKRVPVVDAAGAVVGHDEETTEHVEITKVPPDWRAASRLLESRAMSRFGNRRKVEMQGRLAHLHAHYEMSPEDAAIAERIMNSRLGPGTVRRQLAADDPRRKTAGGRERTDG